jgi:nucleotide-binding universal stress UspA family protein
MSKRKVLIPLDGSEFSRQIVRTVVEFFDPRDVSLVLFRVAQPPGIPLEVSSAHDMMAGGYPISGSYETYAAAIERGYVEAEHETNALRTALMDEMSEEAEHLREMGYAVKLDVQFGDPAQRIVQYVSAEQVGLVAMATHGRSGLSRLVLGSVAERVLRGASVPVLLVRPETETVVRSAGEQLAGALGGGHLRMAVATDGSPFGQRAVTQAIDLYRAFGGKLTVLVTSSGRAGAAQAQQVMKETRALIADLDTPLEMIPLVGYADEILLQYLQSHPVNLFVIGAFADRGAGPGQAVGPTAQRLVQEATTSVLLLKGHRHTLRRILASAGVEDDAVVAVAAQLAEVLGAELKLLHVMPPSAAPYLGTTPSGAIDVETAVAQGTRLSKVIRQWEKQLRAHGFDRNCIILQPGSAPEVILQQTRDGDYDLIIAGTESSPGHFPGSIANTVVRFAEQSVLLVRARVNA